MRLISELARLCKLTSIAIRVLVRSNYCDAIRSSLGLRLTNRDALARASEREREKEREREAFELLYRLVTIPRQSERG